jgi:hypothetical protein
MNSKGVGINKIFLWKGGEIKISSERHLKHVLITLGRLSRVILTSMKFWP